MTAMEKGALPSDPYSLIITGVGGQGNVLASRVVGRMLSRKGYQITIGETFGASQRGGSVMSHLRVSQETTWSPQIPAGRADVVVALEPVEALRVLGTYGNPEVKVLCNTRPIHPAGVIAGDLAYPPMEDLEAWIRELSGAAWFLDATEEAMRMGNPIFGNILMIGALAAIEVLPLTREDFETVLSEDMTPEKVAKNLAAFDLGVEKVRA